MFNLGDVLKEIAMTNFPNIWEHFSVSWRSCSCLYPIRKKISWCSITLCNSWLNCFAHSIKSLLGLKTLNAISRFYRMHSEKCWVFTWTLEPFHNIGQWEPSHGSLASWRPIRSKYRPMRTLLRVTRSEKVASARVSRGQHAWMMTHSPCSVVLCSHPGPGLMIDL